MNILSVKEVKISFNNKTILNNINLSVGPGRIISISGKTGSGKTTLLSMISGLLKPDSGEILFKGKDIYKWMDLKRSKYRNKNIGFIYQSFNLLPDCSILQNIIYPAIINFSSEDVKGQAGFLLKYLEIDDIGGQLPSAVSGGEKQRAAIARALINRPEIILADEPTGNLDTNTGKSIFTLFKKIQKEFGVTFIIASHDKYIINHSDYHYTIENRGLSILKQSVFN